jgi:hypothetical protein
MTTFCSQVRRGISDVCNQIADMYADEWVSDGLTDADDIVDN